MLLLLNLWLDFIKFWYNSLILQSYSMGKDIYIYMVSIFVPKLDTFSTASSLRKSNNMVKMIADIQFFLKQYMEF